MDAKKQSKGLANLTGREPKATLDLGTVWVEPGAIKAFERILDAESMQGGMYELLTDMLQRHASGEYGDLDEIEAHEIPGKVRSDYGGVYGAEIVIETDLNEKVTRVLWG